MVQTQALHFHLLPTTTANSSFVPLLASLLVVQKTLENSLTPSFCFFAGTLICDEIECFFFHVLWPVKEKKSEAFASPLNPIDQDQVLHE